VKISSGVVAFGSLVSIRQWKYIRYCRGSEIIFNLSKNYRRAERKETVDALDRTSCDSLFQTEMVLGKND